VTAALAGCDGANRRPDEPVPTVEVTDVLNVAGELGMKVERDAVSQALILTDGVNRVVITPETPVALVNGAFVNMGASARFRDGRLLVPVRGLKRVTDRLKPRPRSTGGGG